MSKHKKLPAAFYQSANGKEPVRDWLRELDDESKGLSDATLLPPNSVGLRECRWHAHLETGCTRFDRISPTSELLG